MRAEGMLIGESVARELVLADIDITLSKVSHADFGDVSADQPLTWTMIEFSVAVEHTAAFSSALSDALDSALGWYCDFRSPDETFVVFAGQQFRYPRGDRARRAEVEAYARSVGVPESQIDWPE
jgi:hypothetical protein